jgi:hypothetical protein
MQPKPITNLFSIDLKENMMKSLLMAILVAAGLQACQSNPSQTESAAPETLAAVAQPVSQPIENAQAQGEGTNYRLTYQDVTRVLTIWEMSKNSIKFRLQVMDAEGDCDEDLNGTAQMREGDGETRENSEGEEVFANQYDFEMTGCGISILLEGEGKNHAWVEQWDCESHDGKCAYGAEFAFPKVD